MGVRVDITASAVIDLTDKQYAYLKEYADATGLSIERLIADQSGIWWRDFEECADITVEGIDIT